MSPIDCGVSRDRVYRRQRLRGRRGGAVNNFVRFSGAVGGGLIGCEVSGDLLLLSVSEADSAFELFLFLFRWLHWVT